MQNKIEVLLRYNATKSCDPARFARADAPRPRSKPHGDSALLTSAWFAWRAADGHDQGDNVVDLPGGLVLEGLTSRGAIPAPVTFAAIRLVH